MEQTKICYWCEHFTGRTPQITLDILQNNRVPEFVSDICICDNTQVNGCPLIVHASDAACEYFQREGHADEV